MKASTSTTSLTALTEVVSESECFICLDSENPLVNSSVLRKCGCKFLVHNDCWYKWSKGKDEWACPICNRNTPVVNTNTIVNIRPVTSTLITSLHEEMSAIRPFYQYYAGVVCIFCTLVMLCAIIYYLYNK